MGSPKGLLDYHDTPWILEQISRYSSIDNPKVYIGLGHDFQQYLDTIPWFINAIDRPYIYNGVEVRVIINNQPQFGSFSTLQTVLNKVNKNTTIIVQPIDVPLLNKQSLMSIINENNVIVIPCCNDKNGHPVKLKPEFWNRLLVIDISSNQARLDMQIKKLDNSSISYINTTDKSVCQNINTINKWNNYINNNLTRCAL